MRSPQYGSAHHASLGAACAPDPAHRLAPSRQRCLSIPLQDVGCDAHGDPLRGLVHRVSREVRVARRGLDLSVAQQTSDHREAFSQRQGAAGVRMAQVVQPDVMKSRARSYGAPSLVDVPQVRARLPAWQDPGIPIDAWQG